MKKQSFFKSLLRKDKYMVGDLFFLYLIQGVFVILIGSILPMMKEEYQLNYEIGGWLISAHNVGNVIAGLCAGLLPMIIGMKRSILCLNAIAFVGFFITLLTGNPIILIFALFLTGLGRGSISNYNNQIVSAISGGSSSMLNALHGFFAIGAVTAPILTLMFTNNNEHGWRIAVYVIIALGGVSLVTSSFMKVDSISENIDEGNNRSFAFLKERPFVISLFIALFYLCVEASVMGWMVTYYIDSGVITESSTQLLTSLLWIVILIGRFICTALGSKVSSQKIIRILSAGILVFLVIVILSHSKIPMLIGTIGLGLSLSGMYGTTVANAGDVFGRYPLAMGTYIFLSGFGSIITPTIIGTISETSNIRIGMAVLLVPALILFVLGLFNKGPELKIADENK